MVWTILQCIDGLRNIVPAAVHDLKIYQQVLPEILDYDKFADKAYPASSTNGTKTYTPVKKSKGQAYLDATDSLYSTAVSKIRQPIECMLKWSGTPENLANNYKYWILRKYYE